MNSRIYYCWLLLFSSFLLLSCEEPEIQQDIPLFYKQLSNPTKLIDLDSNGIDDLEIRDRIVDFVGSPMLVRNTYSLDSNIMISWGTRYGSSSDAIELGFDSIISDFLTWQMEYLLIGMQPYHGVDLHNIPYQGIKITQNGHNYFGWIRIENGKYTEYAIDTNALQGVIKVGYNIKYMSN